MITPSPERTPPGGGFLLFSLLLLAWGCRPGPGGEEGPFVEVDSSQESVAEALPPSSSPLLQDSGLTVPSDSFPRASDPGGEEVLSQGGVAPSPDSVALLPQGTLERLERLEAENDSLRAAVGLLLSVRGADGVVAPQGTPEAGAAQEGAEGPLLDVAAEQVQHWGLRIVVSIAFILLSGAVIRMVVWVLDKLAERNPKRRLLFKRLVPIARISLWFFVILIVGALILRVEAQGLLAAGAAVGVAVGFAAQDILKNIFGGLIVLFDQPFQVGDKVQVAGTYGEVQSIGLRSTRIVTPDDNLVSVPNAQIVDGQVANANAGELNCQVVTDLYLPGWVDEAVAKKIAFDAAVSSRYVFLNKPIVVLVKDEFKETFLLHLKVKAYVLDPRYEFLLMSDVTERARAGFRAAGLTGPLHGVRAYLNLDGVPPKTPPGVGKGEDE